MDEMIAGARVEVAPYKKDAQDFILWKPSKPGEPAWPSPAGITTPGRPGWHIECSAMAWKHLGETFDIHGGGIDLVFPHHENEIAQSRCSFSTDVMANYWMHNGFLQVEGEKMSKSLGNFVTIHELLKDWPGEVVRLNMLRTHYRQPIDWTVKGLEESSKVLDGWYDIIGDETSSSGTPDAEFVSALCDDLNTPNALTHLHRIAGEIRGPESGPAHIESKRTLRASGMLVGLMAQSRRKFMQAYPRRAVVDEAKVTSLIDARTAARAAKNWKESDRIRDELAAMGVVLKDSKDGTTWEIAR
jgi:cysteinyl-tRNA synthetase